MRYISLGLILALIALPSTADARVKKIVVEKKVSPAELMQDAEAVAEAGGTAG